MKKRVRNWIVAFCMLVLIAPMLGFKAEAASALGSAPYAKVEYGYSAGVTCGTIRYISQLTSSGYFNWSYWPASNSLTNYGTPGYECGTASMSMALSYIGVNKTPYDLLVPYDGSTMFIDWGDGKHSSVGTSASAISTAMDKYVNGNGKYSPVVVYLNPYSSSGGMHYVVLAGKEASNKYTVIDPANNSTWTMTISGSSGICPSGTFPITQAHQWYNANASITPEKTKPGKPALKGMNSFYPSGSATQFQWNATETTTHYNLYIGVKNASGEYETYKNIFYAESGCSYNLPDGEYQVLLQSTNSNAWTADGSTWEYTNGDLVYFTVGPNVIYYDASGSTWNTASATVGSSYTLRTDYPKTDGKYFSGWTYTKEKNAYDVRPGEQITASASVKLYPVYVTHEQAVSGDEVEIYNIEDFTDSNYDIEKVEHKTENKIDTSYWTDWSSYGLSPITASSTVQVQTATMYRYYYFLCPSCGRHEPFTGKSDCGAQIPTSAWNETWSRIPYSQSSYGTFSYTTAKYYTTSLGDGQTWIFSSGNLNATSVGTTDATGSAEVIKTGYSSRRYVEQYKTETTIKTAYKITPKIVEYTLSYDANGGSSAPSSQKADSGTSLKLSTEKPSRSGYDFLGWATTKSAAKAEYQPGDTLTLKENVTLYAVWQEVVENAAEITVGIATATVGGKVSIPVTIKNNPGIAGAALVVSYDTSALTLDSIEAGTVFAKGVFSPRVETGLAQWYYVDTDENITANGTMYALNFTVNEGAKEGGYPIQIGLKDNEPTNLIEKNSAAVPVHFTAGEVKVQSGIMGDVTGDDKVTMGDVVKLARAVSGYTKLSEQETQLGDVTKDGKITMGDVVKVARYVSGYTNAL